MYRGTFFYAQTGRQNLKLQNSKHSYLKLGVQYGQMHSPGYRDTLILKNIAIAKISEYHPDDINN